MIKNVFQAWTRLGAESETLADQFLAFCRSKKEKSTLVIVSLSPLGSAYGLECWE
jgi:hypothetical protein